MRDEKWVAEGVDLPFTISRDIRINERGLFELKEQGFSNRVCIREEFEFFLPHHYLDVTLLVEALKLLP